MTRKIAKYIRGVLEEEKKGLLVKYKENIDTISSLCAIATFVIMIITVLFQFWNSDQAAQFYKINPTYFFQESVSNMIFEGTIRVLIIVFRLFFPFAVAFFMSYFIEQTKKTKFNEKGISENERHGAWLIYFLKRLLDYTSLILKRPLDYISLILEWVLLCMIWLVTFVHYVQISAAYTSSNERIILTLLLRLLRLPPLPPLILPVYFFILFCYLLACCEFSKNNKNFKNIIHRDHRAICIFLGLICLVFGIYFYLELKNDAGKSDWWEIFTKVILATYFISVQWIPECRRGKSKGLSFLFVILVSLAWWLRVLVPPLFALLFNFMINPYTIKQDYEIVQKMSSSNLEEQVTQKEFNFDYQEEQKNTEEPFQVVILHRGSQVLLMHGEIDGQKIINPQEDITSSSNLVIDTGSYEFQEASQYRFYRKTFNTVKTNDTKKQD